MKLKLGLFAIAAVALLQSCNSRDRVCREDYILKIDSPTYLSCDPARLTYEVRWREGEIMMEDKCECEYHMELLEESFWELVENKPSDTHFMYNESPPQWKCEKN